MAKVVNTSMCRKVGTSRFDKNSNMQNPKKVKIPKVNLAVLIPVTIGKTKFWAKDEAHKLRIMTKYSYLLNKPQLNQL